MAIRKLERVNPKPKLVEREPGPWVEIHQKQRDRIIEWVSYMVVAWLVAFILAVRYMEPVQPVPTGEPTNEELYLGENNLP